MEEVPCRQRQVAEEVEAPPLQLSLSQVRQDLEQAVAAIGEGPKGERGAPGPPGSSHLAPLGSDMPSFTAATMSLARARPESASLRGSRRRAELRGLLPSFAFDGD